MRRSRSFGRRRSHTAIAIATTTTSATVFPPPTSNKTSIRNLPFLLLLLSLSSLLSPLSPLPVPSGYLLFSAVVLLSPLPNGTAAPPSGIDGNLPLRPPFASFADASRSMAKAAENTARRSGGSMADDGGDGGFRFDSPFLSPPPRRGGRRDGTETGGDTATALVILNSPMRKPPSPIFDRLWSVSHFRVCADGGANRLYDATALVEEEEGEGFRDDDGRPSTTTSYVPDIILGDLDSLLPAVSSFYRQKGTIVRRVADQNSSDLDKALQAVLDWHTSQTTTVDGATVAGDAATDRPLDVYIYGAFGGRFDHEMSALGALYTWGPSFQNRLFLYDDRNCAFLLPPETEARIQLPPPNAGDDVGGGGGGTQPSAAAMGEGPTCGLLPIGGRCDAVTTTGLEWDLDGSTPLEFGGLVSTSNRMVGGVVTVRSSHPLVFTAEVRCPKSEVGDGRGVGGWGE